MTTEDKCPPECKQDRATLHRRIDEIKLERKEKWRHMEDIINDKIKASTMKWAIGIVLAAVISLTGVAFGLLNSGQQLNATKIDSLRNEMNTELRAINLELKSVTAKLEEVRRDRQNRTKD